MRCKTCVYGALSNNLVTNNKCITCTYYKNNDEGDYNYVVKDWAGSYDRAVEQLVIKCCDTCEWSSRPCVALGDAGPACPYGDNYVKAPRFHGLRVYNPLYRVIEGDDNAEAIRPESPSNMVDPYPANVVALAAQQTMKKNPEIKGNPSALLSFLISADHLNPVEHAVICFRITDVSRACFDQHVRHRIASYTSSSQHYQDYTSYDCFVHPYMVNDERVQRRILKR